MLLYRCRFRNEILAEFLPPARPARHQRVIILCDGFPSLPRKQPLVRFLSGQGYWVFYPRWRGAWESGGRLLEQAPHRDILDIVADLPRGVTELAFSRRFDLSPDQIFVIGGSFGGAAAILSSLDRRVRKVVANCPVVDWTILNAEQRQETSNPSYPAYIRDAFGPAYRLSDRNWSKLGAASFFSPVHRAGRITPGKIMIFHAKDDPFVPFEDVSRFAERTASRFIPLARGGHLPTEHVIETYWPRIRRFLQS